MGAEVHEWAVESLRALGVELRGPLAPVKERPWARVYVGDTDQGRFYLKQSGPGGRHEVGLAHALAKRWPDRVAAPLAADSERGWMLTRDLGEPLREVVCSGGESLSSSWRSVLARYAEIQVGSAAEPERWLALGMPDRTPERIPHLAEELLGRAPGLTPSEREGLRAGLPELEARCRALAEGPLKPALEHGDLHAGNVLAGPSGTWIFDWGDASWSHPLSSLLVALDPLYEGPSSVPEDVREGWIAAYLEPFGQLAPLAACRELLPVAHRVALVSRALDFDHMLQGSDAMGRARWQPEIARWLRLGLDRDPA